MMDTGMSDKGVRVAIGLKNGWPTDSRTGGQRTQERVANGLKNGRPTDSRTGGQRTQERVANVNVYESYYSYVVVENAGKRHLRAYIN